ncbi:DUF7823 domain-containing protein, partial [Xenorhabdus sp. IM139775]|uniref:DUF7823 domain-containing protein n=1 Tax=Xenorhabdus sp. IM139775 TaxID=3025876 RepID=UPI003FD217AC
VGGVPYHLGSSAAGSFIGEQQYEFVGSYNNASAQELGALLKQNVGKTLHFIFHWK